MRVCSGQTPVINADINKFKLIPAFMPQNYRRNHSQVNLSLVIRSPNWKPNVNLGMKS